jgi:hypothetical protein
LTDKEKEDMKDLGLKRGIKDMINGFFFESFYIQTATSHIMFDRQLHIIEQKGDFNFTMGKGSLNCPIQGISDYKSIILTIDDVKISLRKYNNPQVLNGINVSVGNLANAKGLLNSFCNPKNYSIKKIKNVNPVIVVQDKMYNKKVKEHWVKTK